MSYNRSFIAGMTDYTGVDLSDILQHLNEWYQSTQHQIGELKKIRSRVDENRDQIDVAQDLYDYIDFFIELFERYSKEFKRLTQELPSEVKRSHVQAIEDLYHSAKIEEKNA